MEEKSLLHNQESLLTGSGYGSGSLLFNYYILWLSTKVGDAVLRNVLESLAHLYSLEAREKFRQSCI